METHASERRLICDACGDFRMQLAEVAQEHWTVRCSACRRVQFSVIGLTNTQMAVGMVRVAIGSDLEYRRGWQANIAMSTVDEFVDLFSDYGHLHTLANNAAHRFLCILVGRPLPHWSESFPIYPMKEKPKMSWDLARRVIFDFVGPMYDLIDRLVNGAELTGASGEDKHQMVREDALEMAIPLLPDGANLGRVSEVIDAAIHSRVRMKNRSGEFAHIPVAPGPPPGDTIPDTPGRQPAHPGAQHIPSGEHGGGVQHVGSGV